jgi:hypothetical protein
MTREPRISEASLAALRPVVVAPDGVTLTELPGSTLLLLDADMFGADRDPIDGADLDQIDCAALQLLESRVLNLAHLVKWAIAQGYSLATGRWPRSASRSRIAGQVSHQRRSRRAGRAGRR